MHSAERDSAKWLEDDLAMTEHKIGVAKRPNDASLERVRADKEAELSRTVRDLKRENTTKHCQSRKVVMNWKLLN